MISVLLVDNDLSIQESLKGYLERGGQFKVDLTKSAEEATTKLASATYDAIICDCSMAGMTGLGFLKAIRSEKNDISFILFTGEDQEDIAIDALNSGADFYLEKGHDPTKRFAELATMVAQSVNTRRTELEAEKRLVESEERYKSIFENSGAATVMIDNDMTVIMMNAEFERISGFSKEEIIGRKWTEFVSRDDLPKLVSYHRQRRKDESRTPKSYDIQLLDKSGRTRTFRSTVSMIPGTLKSVASLIDITERIEAERLARESEKFMVSVFTSIQDGISILDRDLNILRVNPTMERWYAHNMPLVGRKCYQAYHGRDVPCEVCPTLQTLRTGKTAVEIVPKTGADKEVVGWLELYSFPKLDPATGELEGVIEYVRDVSDRKHYEDALRQANEKLNLMGSVTRHDALNQLSVLTGWLSIAMNSSTDRKLLEYLTKSYDAAQMIRSQLEFTADYQEMGIRGPVWLFVDAALTRGIAGLRFGDVVLTQDLKGLEIYADRMLDKVFHNLTDNSLRHGGRLTNIDVTYERSGSALKILFADDGEGIPKEEKEKIFTHGHGKHTGYGLYMARAILGITGIAIEETGDPGKGAVFTITVPSQKFRIHGKRE